MYNVWTFIKNCTYMKIQFNSAFKAAHNHTFASGNIKHRQFGDEPSEEQLLILRISRARIPQAEKTALLDLVGDKMLELAQLQFNRLTEGEPTKLTLEYQIELFHIGEARANALRKAASAGHLKEAISAVITLQSRTLEELRQQEGIPQEYWAESYDLLTNFGGS